MNKYIVRLSDEEAKICEERPTGSSVAARRPNAPASCCKRTLTGRLGRTARLPSPAIAR